MKEELIKLIQKTNNNNVIRLIYAYAKHLIKASTQ